MLKASNIKRTDWHSLTLAKIAKKKAANGGKNYLEWTDAFMLAWEVLYFPMNWLHEYTYTIAKRRSRRAGHKSSPSACMLMAPRRGCLIWSANMA